MERLGSRLPAAGSAACSAASAQPTTHYHYYPAHCHRPLYEPSTHGSPRYDRTAPTVGWSRQQLTAVAAQVPTTTALLLPVQVPVLLQASAHEDLLH